MITMGMRLTQSALKDVLALILMAMMHQILAITMLA
jgi:hypothetical protein